MEGQIMLINVNTAGNKFSSEFNKSQGKNKMNNCLFST